MSVVVAQRIKGKIVMASDSLATNYGDDEVGVDSDVKMFYKGPVLIGFVGSYRIARILEFDVEPEPRPKRGLSRLGYLHKLSHAFREGVDDKAHINTENGTEAYVGLLLALDGHLFSMDGNFGVTAINEPYWAIGVGGPYALGAFHAGADPRGAVKAAIAHCNSVGGKIHIIREGLKK